MENSAPRVLHYYDFAPRRMNYLHLFIVLSFFLHNVTQISGRWSWAALPPAELAESHLCSVSTQTHSSPAGTEPPARVGPCCAGIVLSADPKLWKDSLMVTFYHMGFFPSLCSWVFLLGRSEWNVIGLGGFIFSHGLVLVTALEDRTISCSRGGFSRQSWQFLAHTVACIL